MSENLKLTNILTTGDHQQDRLARSLDPSGVSPVDNTDDAESQMRKALGLLGEGPRHRVDAERTDTPNRGGDRFGGGLHRRRFVQDGDVPVTVLRRDPGHESPAHRSVVAPVPPATSRLQRAEAALTAETAAREKAERLLIETQIIVRDLQTKIGHAELAKTEAVEALRRERESSAQNRADAEAREACFIDMQARVQAAGEAAQTYQEQLLEERQARKMLEKALRTAEAAREASEQLVKTMSKEAAEQLEAPQSKTSTQKMAHSSAETIDVKSPEGELADVAALKIERLRTGKLKPESRTASLEAEPEFVAVTARRGRAQVDSIAEPEPVKWWLNTKAGTKRR